MKRLLYIFIHSLCFPLLAISSFMANAATREVRPEISTTVSVLDSLSRTPLLLHFRQNRSLVEYDYMDNPRTLESFSVLFADSLSAVYVDTITIFSYASPEGDARHNLTLARQRAIAVKGYLLWKYPHLDRERLLIDPVGEDWGKLRELVVSDDSVPDREDVLCILDEIPDRDRCKVLLKKLNCGYAYRYISKKLLPQLRNAAVCLVKLKAVQPDFVAEHDSVLNHVDQKESTIPYSQTCQQSMPDWQSTPDQCSLPLLQSASSSPEQRRASRPLFALKTNLLFDHCHIPEH